MFNVNANLFRACALFQSTETTRYYLAGVHVEPCPNGGIILAATEGHRALIAHDPDGSTDGRYIVSLDKAALSACKADRHEALPRRVTSDMATDPVWITDAAGEQLHIAKNWLVDGTFPDWRRVLPAPSAGMHTAYDARLVASFAPVAAILNSKGSHCISLATNDKEGPTLVRFADSEAVFGVITPMRWKGEGPVNALPAFMSSPAAANKAA